MAEGVEPMDESQGTEVKTQQPTERVLAGPLRRGSGSVLKVSQLLLSAIASHKRLTLAALKKEFGNAGYEVRRTCGRLSGERCRSEGKSLLLRVSGSEAAGYFRIWKVPKPKPKRKPGRPRLEEGGRFRIWKVPKPKPKRKPGRPRLEGGGRLRTPLGARKSRRRSALRTAARKVRGGRARADSRKVRSRAKDLVSARTKQEGRAQKEAIGPRSRNAKRPSSKAREAKKQGPERPVKRTVQRPASSKTSRPPHGQAKARNSRATRTKTSAKAEGARSANRSPQCGSHAPPSRHRCLPR